MFDEDVEDVEDEELDGTDSDPVSLDDVGEIDVVDDDVVLDPAVDDEDEDYPAVKKTVAKSKAAEVELPSLEAKNRERDELARAMEEFLSRGGKIQEVSPQD